MADGQTVLTHDDVDDKRYYQHAQDDPEHPVVEDKARTRPENGVRPESVMSRSVLRSRVGRVRRAMAQRSAIASTETVVSTCDPAEAKQRGNAD